MPPAACHVPIIDLAPFRSGDAAARRAIAAAVDRALVDIGFFVVTGHGVDWRGIEACADTCRRFFDRPLEHKLAVASEGIPFRGYLGYGGEDLSYTEDEATPPDWKENFVMGREDLADAYFRRVDVAPAFPRNRWPQHMPELRAAMLDYYAAMEDLTARLMQVLALALALEPDFFRQRMDRHDSTLRATNYPHQDRAPAPGQLRAGAHTDYGAITILKVEDAPGGLQVRTRAGTWVDVPVVREGFVINIGDLMMTWTNDRWLSNMHRVINPPADAAGSTRRQSMVYFANCNPDARIECLPGCHGPGNPVRHAPITAGEHRRAKLAKSAKVAIG